MGEEDMFLRTVTKEVVTTEQDYIDLGLQLGFDEPTITRNRTNNPLFIELAAWRLGCEWWYSDNTISTVTKKERLKQAILDMGKGAVVEDLGL